MPLQVGALGERKVWQLWLRALVRAQGGVEARLPEGPGGKQVSLPSPGGASMALSPDGQTALPPRPPPVTARRSESSSEGSDSSALRLLSALLTEMDGMELATGVLVLAATNRPAAIDAALMRPGRLDVQLYVPPPDLAGRLEVLRVHTAGMPLAEDVDLAELAADTDRFSGERVSVGICTSSLAFVQRFHSMETRRYS